MDNRNIIHNNNNINNVLLMLNCSEDAVPFVKGLRLLQRNHSANVLFGEWIVVKEREIPPKKKASIQNLFSKSLI